MSYVLGFVGENANGILRRWTEQILAGFARHGLGYQLVDLCDGRTDALQAVLAAGAPAMCFSFQGFGMDLRAEGENFWSRSGIPFVSYLGDNPYLCPRLHAAEGSGLYLLFGCLDFLQTYRDLMRGTNVASVVQYGHPANPEAETIAWRDRPHRAVFAKTRVDPLAFEREWETLPPLLRSIAHTTAELVLSGIDRPIHSLCQAVIAEHDVHIGTRLEIPLFLCTTVDRYVRAVRAERMVRALLQHDALIVGEWSHLDDGGVRACILPPRNAQLLDGLYARSKLVLNTQPSVRYGLHERISAGLLARSAVVSDATPYMLSKMAACPAFIGLDIDADDFGDRLGETLAGVQADPEMPDKLDRSYKAAQSMFSMDTFVDALIGFAGIEPHRRRMVPWSFPPQEKAA